MSWSPYKESVINYVLTHPGCCKFDVAKHCTKDSRRNPSKQYYIVNTAIRNKWIRAEYSSGRYRLFANN